MFSKSLFEGQLQSRSGSFCQETLFVYTYWASLVAQLVKDLPAMWEIWIRSLGWQDPLEKGTASRSSILDWVAKSWTQLSDFHFSSIN